MAYHIVGLDIGSRTVRAVLFERSFRGYEVSEAREAQVTQGEGGAPPTREAVAEAVQAVIGDLARSQTTVVCAYPVERASVWFFTMPFTDPRRIAQTVAFEVEDMVPFDLEDMLFQYRVTRADSSTSQIMAVLAPRAQVGQRLEWCQGAGVDPIALILDAHAVGNALDGRRPEARAILDIGHRHTLITVVRDGQVEHVQAVPVGGLEVTRALMERWGLPFAVAEHLKHHRALPAGYERPRADAGDAPGAAGSAAPGEAEPTAPLPGEAGGDDGPITTLSWRALDEEDAPELDTLTEADITRAAFQEEPADWRGYKAIPEPWEQGAGADADELIPFGDEDTAILPQPAPEPAPAPLEPISRADVDEAILEAVGELLGPLRAGLLAYETTHRSEIKEVVLLGGGALLPELAPQLSGDLGVPVSSPSRLGEDHSALPGAASSAAFGLAFALGLRGVTDGKLKEIDLRREEFASRGDIHRLRVGMAAAVAAVVLVALAGLAWSALRYSSLQKEIASLDAQIAAVVAAAVPDGSAGAIKSPEAALVVLTDELLLQQSRARVLKVADEQPHTAVRVLQEISDYLSPGSPGDDEFVKVDIDEYQAGEATVRLKGYTDSFDATGKIESSLRKSGMFADVTMSDVSSDRRQEDRKNFTLTLSVVAEGGEDVEASGG